MVEFKNCFGGTDVLEIISGETDTLSYIHCNVVTLLILFWGELWLLMEWTIIEPTGHELLVLYCGQINFIMLGTILIS